MYAFAFSRDGTRLASASKDRSVRLWDVESGAQLARLDGHAGAVNDVAFSPDGALLASASEDGSVRLWEAQSGAQLARQAGHEGRVNAVASSPDGTRLASASDDRSVRLWDAQSGAQLARLDHEVEVGAWPSVPTGPGWPRPRRAASPVGRPGRARRPSAPAPSPSAPRPAGLDHGAAQQQQPREPLGRRSGALTLLATRPGSTP